MKVLHVIDTLGVGGAERLLITALPELARRGHSITVAVMKAPYDLQVVLEDAGIPVVRLPARHKWNLFASARDIAMLCDELDVNILHAHLYFPAVCSSLVRSFRLAKVRTVTTFHNLAYAEGVNKAGVGLSLKKKLASLAYPAGIDQCLAVSSVVSHHYSKELGLDGIRVIHNPIDISIVDRVIRMSSEHRDAELHIVLPGRLVHEKGHGLFLSAIATIAQELPPFRVSIAGGGPLRDDLEQKISALGLEGLVTVTGNLDHAVLLELVHSASMVVVPSLSEGFGLTALEAMALSKLVVASDVGGLKEVIVDGESGVLFPVGDSKALASILLELVNSPELMKQIGLAARERAEAAFSLGMIADQYIDVYQEQLQHAQ
ncbi:hypothetical protein A3709_10445 [Halioglobus sp. HI00S01]|uniref:glycosyltransferase family 4 protein n=1 Tax=Halioglobus sp. HI00S01 TaxID=1822214 RepID=UPI0007C2736A|nr:glycosyltransferase family 4 protein [Halioglobus sp. HI00S01]KZX51241.1 hypothetical protein A3709_10445 [Halioglobus sp. HI00S01]